MLFGPKKTSTAGTVSFCCNNKQAGDCCQFAVTKQKVCRNITDGYITANSDEWWGLLNHDFLAVNDVDALLRLAETLAGEAVDRSGF